MGYRLACSQTFPPRPRSGKSATPAPCTRDRAADTKAGRTHSWSTSTSSHRSWRRALADARHVRSDHWPATPKILPTIRHIRISEPRGHPPCTEKRPRRWSSQHKHSYTAGCDDTGGLPSAPSPGAHGGVPPPPVPPPTTPDRAAQWGAPPPPGLPSADLAWCTWPMPVPVSPKGSDPSDQSLSSESEALRMDSQLQPDAFSGDSPVDAWAISPSEASVCPDTQSRACAELTPSETGHSQKCWFETISSSRACTVPRGRTKKAPSADVVTRLRSSAAARKRTTRLASTLADPPRNARTRVHVTPLTRLATLNSGC